MAKAKISAAELSSGIEFIGLELPNSNELSARYRLCFVINRILAERGLTQVEAAKVLGTRQPDMWALKHFKLEKFSFERLMRFATALDHDVVIEIRPRAKLELSDAS